MDVTMWRVSSSDKEFIRSPESSDVDARSATRRIRLFRIQSSQMASAATSVAPLAVATDLHMA